LALFQFINNLHYSEICCYGIFATLFCLLIQVHGTLLWDVYLI